MAHVSVSTRRSFLRSASLAAAWPSPAGQFATSLAALGALAQSSTAVAQSGSGYRALVCLFMFGGNDSHNWLVPTDAAAYGDYAKARQSLAIARERLLPLAASTHTGSRALGLAPELQPLKAWYDSGQCGFVCNVGPLLGPTTKADFAAGRGLPRKLFSHNDQQSTWQTLSPEGAASGWGGRMGDVLASANARPVFTAVSAAGNAAFLSGRAVDQFQVGQDGPASIQGATASHIHGFSGGPQALQQVMRMAGNNDFQREHARIGARALEAGEQLRAALATGPALGLPTTPVTLPNGNAWRLDQDSLARQLRTVARMIEAGPRLGLARQVFFVSLGGFDTHTSQLRDHPQLSARVAHSSAWFLQAMRSLGLLNNTLLFTASDFGRTLVSNGDGSDHGWGGHHFVAGGGVRGRQVHGAYPNLQAGSPDDLGAGRLLPSLSVQQYAASLGLWLGVNSSQLVDALPRLQAFDSSALRLTL